MSPLEAIAVLLGLANIVLLVRRSIWNYPFGIATVSLYGLIFFRERLYSDALLQGLFLALNIYGWANWVRASDTADDAEGRVPVQRMPGAGVGLCALGAAGATLAWGTIMHRYTDAAMPYWDASVAMMSVLAQYLLARRYIDNWAWWIAVDLVAVPLYWAKGLHLTAGLYVVYLLLSTTGLFSWISAQRRLEPAAA
ncbi:nicotinamide riboside transporter PnuC [Sphingobium aquiterrae]|uniref:nicotinamide riboside transporter PnuC n=1 Tax=Sphingobium aquiterrae TaxID=2038656 RepID=UPI00301A111C